MRTMEWVTRRLLLPAMLGLVIVPVAGATGTLDQSQTVSMSPATVSSGAQHGQIFTPGIYGTLDRVSLRLENYTSSPPEGAVLTVSVQTVIGGLPSGKQIGSGTVPLSAIPAPGYSGWVDVSISGAIVHAGTQYALVLQTSNAFSHVTWWYAYKSDFGSKYAGGAMAFNDGTAWRIDPSHDFTFRTYVFPDTLDQYEHGNGGAISPAGAVVGQIFTAGRSGELDRVRVYLANLSVIDPVEVTIQTVTGGVPSGIVIGRGSAPAPERSGYYLTFNWMSIGISGASVTAGAQYALVLHVGSGFYEWATGEAYAGGYMVCDGPDWNKWPKSAVFETYVAIPPPTSVQSPPPTITPCSSGVCPAVVGSVTPADSTARVTSNVVFQQLRDGRIHGILHFDDSRTGDFVLRGCTTESAACRLTVTTLACTDQDAITAAGAYTPKGAAPGRYWLTLRGTRGGIGTFTLTAGDYTYTLTRNGIVDVTCPPR